MALDGRNREIVFAESLARVIAAIRITSVHWRSYLPPRDRNQSSVLIDPALVALAIRVARLAFIHVTFIPRRIGEWAARVGCVRRTLATGDFQGKTKGQQLKGKIVS